MILRPEIPVHSSRGLPFGLPYMQIGDYLDWGVRIAFAGGMIGGIWRVGTWSLRALRQVRSVWAFLCDRAELEAIDMGWATDMELDPSKITPVQRAAFDPLLPDLTVLYGQLLVSCADANERRLFIQMRYGRRLSQEVCPFIGTRYGACLVMADYLAKEAFERAAMARRQIPADHAPGQRSH